MHDYILTSTEIPTLIEETCLLDQGFTGFMERMKQQEVILHYHCYIYY